MKIRLEPGTLHNRSGMTLIVAGFLIAAYFGYLDYREIVITFPATFHLLGHDRRRGVSLLAWAPVSGASNCPKYFRRCETGRALSRSVPSRPIAFKLCRLVVYVAPVGFRHHYRGGTTARRFAAVWRSRRHHFSIALRQSIINFSSGSRSRDAFRSAPISRFTNDARILSIVGQIKTLGVGALDNQK